MLHGLERMGYLLSRTGQSGKRAHRVYKTTPVGPEAQANATVKELFGELFEEVR
jgi:hypothetical protein